MSADIPPSPAEREAVRLAARADETERYLSALLAPRSHRDDLIAIAAAVGAIARIPFDVREPMMGEIRLQWWRDALAASERGEKTGNPVADALSCALANSRLPLDSLDPMLEARAFDLYADPMPSMLSFHGYLDRTEGLAFQLAARLLGVEESRDLSAFTTASGRAWGTARLLAHLPRWLARGRLPLPVDDQAAGGLAPEDLGTPEARERLAGLVAHHAAEARAALVEARARAATLPRAASLACLPIALVAPYLRAVEARRRDPAREVAEITPLQRTWGLWRASLGSGS